MASIDWGKGDFHVEQDLNANLFSTVRFIFWEGEGGNGQKRILPKQTLQRGIEEVKQCVWTMLLLFVPINPIVI